MYFMSHTKSENPTDFQMRKSATGCSFEFNRHENGVNLVANALPESSGVFLKMSNYSLKEEVTVISWLAQLDTKTGTGKTASQALSKGNKLCLKHNKNKLKIKTKCEKDRLWFHWELSAGKCLGQEQ